MIIKTLLVAIVVALVLMFLLQSIPLLLISLIGRGTNEENEDEAVES